MQSAQTSAASATQAGQNSSGASFGTVYRVILDEKDPFLKNKQDAIGNEASYVGAILYRLSSQAMADENSLPVAYPYDKNFKTIPLRNETVEIINSNTGQSFYKRITAESSPNATADDKFISTNFPAQKLDSDSSKDLSKVQATGIAKTNVNASEKYDGLGAYFKRTPGIHKLKLYEGDTILESRFGQSIRFSGYNNPKNVFSPTVIIRNNESVNSLKKVIMFPSEEDINRDGSIIALTSDQYQLEFQPGIIDDKGTSDFTTKPESFDNYPSKLIGDQILLNSGRIILSAKSGEMIFYSKKNYGFISDGGMSIDNKLGIDVTVRDNIHIMTNDRDVAFQTGKGHIFLGNENLEAMVKGETLVALLGELIDAIANQNYLTPSGPSKVGPENLSKFASIKSKLNTVLSKLNQTS
jgi:hypothetical protein